MPERAVSRVLSWTIIHLGPLSPAASSNLPGSPLGTGGAGRACVLPYLVLLRAGFTVPRTVTSRAVRSYRTFSPLPTEAGGIFSVALSMGSRPPGVTWRPVRRSPDFPLQLNELQRLPGPHRHFRTGFYRKYVPGVRCSLRSLNASQTSTPESSGFLHELTDSRPPPLGADSVTLM